MRKFTRIAFCMVAGWMFAGSCMAAGLNVTVPGVGTIVLGDPDWFEARWISARSVPVTLVYSLPFRGGTAEKPRQPGNTWLEVKLEADSTTEPHDTREKVEALLAEENAGYLKGAVEKKTTPVELKATRGIGCYAVNTYPGGGQSLVTGVLVVDGMTARFTIGADDTTGVEFQAALKFIAEGLYVQMLDVPVQPSPRLHAPLQWRMNVMHGIDSPGVDMFAGVNSRDNALGMSLEFTRIAELAPDEAAEMARSVAGNSQEAKFREKTDTKLVPVEVKSDLGIGYYVVYTQNPQRWKGSHQRQAADGLFIMKGLKIGFHITTDDTDGAEFKQAIEMIRRIEFAPRNK